MLFHTIFSHSCTFKYECARAHVLHVHSDIYTYLYAFTGYSVKDGTTGKRDDWLCKNKLKTSRNEMLLKSRKEKKMFLITTDVL